MISEYQDNRNVRTAWDGAFAPIKSEEEPVEEAEVAEDDESAVGVPSDEPSSEQPSNDDDESAATDKRSKRRPRYASNVDLLCLGALYLSICSCSVFVSLFLSLCFVFVDM